jgi:rhodanese-related sulfurtransferase
MEKRLLIGIFVILFMLVGCAILTKSADVPRMTREELRAMLGNPNLVIIDVRYGTDWTGSDLKIKGAVREDSQAVESWANTFPKDKTLVLYCA